MTNDQRIKSILAELEHDYIGHENLHGDDEQGCRIIRDALEKANKYRWHDLRKNPEDLPDDFHNVLICINGFEGTPIGVSIAMHNGLRNLWGTESLSYKDDEVIAWREIEPFESEESE